LVLCEHHAQGALEELFLAEFAAPPGEGPVAKFNETYVAALESGAVSVIRISSFPLFEWHAYDRVSVCPFSF
jgi:hypothetical protein